MRGDFAQVSHAALSRVAGGDSRGVAMDSVDLRWVLVGPGRLRRLRPLLRVAVHCGPAAGQVQRGQQRRRHAGRRIDPAVRGSSLYVRQPKQLGIHQVSRTKVLLIAVAGCIAG